MRSLALLAPIKAAPFAVPAALSSRARVRRGVVRAASGFEDLERLDREMVEAYKKARAALADGDEAAARTHLEARAALQKERASAVSWSHHPPQPTPF